MDEWMGKRMPPFKRKIKEIVAMGRMINDETGQLYMLIMLLFGMSFPWPL
jgi:hypothetical protein